MMLVPANTFDVVPAVSLVTHKALLDFGMHLSRHHLGHHFEMHHVMTGRPLMTLRALLRLRRRMQKTGEFPAIRLMAFGAFPAH